MSIIDKYADFIREQKKEGGMGFKKPVEESAFFSDRQNEVAKRTLANIAAAKFVVHKTDPGEHKNHPDWDRMVDFYKKNKKHAKEMATK